MELQAPQQPPTHIVREISQKSSLLDDHRALAQESDDLLKEICDNIARADEKKEQSYKELKQSLLALTQRLDDASNPLIINAKALTDIANLQMTTSKQTVSIEQLKQRDIDSLIELSQLKQSLTNLQTQHNNVCILSLLNTIGLGINFVLLLYVWYYTHK
jgi:hypothetical protein